MKTAFVAGLFGFGAVLAVKLGASMRTEDAPILTGMIIFGLALGISAAYLLHRANDAMTRRNLAGVGARRSHDSDSGAHGYIWRDTGYDPYLLPAERPQRPLRVQPQVIVEGQFRDYDFGDFTVKKVTGRQKITRYRRIAAGSATATAGPIELETRTPNREPNAIADVGVPAMQALISATIAALLAGMLAYLANRADIPKIMGGAFVIVLAVAWLWRLGVSDRLLEVIERITQTDLDHDGHVGSVGDSHTMLENPNQAREESAKIAAGNKGAIRTQELLSFVTRCHTVGCSESKLGIKPSPSERAKYAELRDTVIALGIGAWRDEARKKLGWELVLSPEQAAPIISKHVRTLKNSAN